MARGVFVSGECLKWTVRSSQFGQSVKTDWILFLSNVSHDRKTRARVTDFRCCMIIGKRITFPHLGKYELP